MSLTVHEMRELAESENIDDVRALARELIAWLRCLKAAGIPIEPESRCREHCGGTMTEGRCEACARLVAQPKTPPLDLQLLHKFATGEGGLRTGALRRGGLITWEVTQEGFQALRDANLWP